MSTGARVGRALSGPAGGPTTVRPTSEEWLLLAYQVPTHPSNARVKTWRRLQELGAVSHRNAVYVLPHTDQGREDFEWIRTEIESLGGAATVFAAAALAPHEGAELVAAFRRARDEDYAKLAADARPVGKRIKSGGRSVEYRRTMRSLLDRLAAIDRIDFFHAPGRARAIQALAAVEESVAVLSEPEDTMPLDPLSPAAFRKRHWVTRPRPGVDRMATAWLIRRFIDPRARFAFAATSGKKRTAPVPRAVPFDMYTGDFSHHGSLCTFETMAQRFAIETPAVRRIGQIVHDLDMKETRYGPPEAPAIGRLIEGLRQLYLDDSVLLEQGIAMFEALARSFEADSATTSPSTPSGRKRPAAPRRSGRTARRG